MTDGFVRLALTAGEPAGIGPELLVRLAQAPWNASLTAVCDPRLLRDAANRAGVPLRILELAGGERAGIHVAGSLPVRAVPLRVASTPGELDPANAPFVLEALATACDGCLAKEYDGVVTAPVHKGVINDAGVAFTGHTEFFGERSGATPLMLLAAGSLRVALVTTHLPLSSVPGAITIESVLVAARLLHRGLLQRIGIDSPRIAVLGLNPHAGEGGYLGSEERESIAPAVAILRSEGIDAVGPLAADTAFVPSRVAAFDAVLAMYHDQALPVLKHAGFGHAVNITLGLPFVRTSVDHGVALDIATLARADPSSLFKATELAIALSQRARSLT